MAAAAAGGAPSVARLGYFYFKTPKTGYKQLKIRYLNTSARMVNINFA